MNLKQTLTAAITIIIVALMITTTSWADCRGCCRGHGGVRCIDGVTQCKDGTPLSTKCRAKCFKCGESAASSQAVTQPAEETAGGSQSVAATGSGNTIIQSFNKAKKILLNQIYHDHRITFYCECPFTAKKQVEPCDKYTPKRNNKRAKRIEWEHVVPAAHFGQSFSEWRDGHPDCVNSKGKAFRGRNCASKINMEYRYMQSDMFNLVPAIGEVNGLRSNYRFGMIAGESRDFGACDMEISGKVAEPPERVRGNIARTYQYMQQAYPRRGIIGKSNKKLFQAWSKLDPVDEWECTRCKRIEAVQGNENSIVKSACQKAGLW